MLASAASDLTGRCQYNQHGEKQHVLNIIFIIVATTTITTITIITITIITITIITTIIINISSATVPACLHLGHRLLAHGRHVRCSPSCSQV